MEENTLIPKETSEEKVTQPIVPAPIGSPDTQLALALIDDDGPLTQIEIFPEFGSPVVVDGVDVIRSIYIYAEVMNRTDPDGLSQADPLVELLEKEGENLASADRSSTRFKATPSGAKS